MKIDGKWCQMDPTWDDTSDNWYGDLNQRHLYFGPTDELMAIAHSDHAANYQAEGYAYRSTDLSNSYFVRNGKADEWANAYAERIQQHLDAKETEFSIDADNQSFPPSISGIQNGIVAYAMDQRTWDISCSNKADLTATSKATTLSKVHVDPLIEGDGVAVATGLPVAGQAWFHQQELALVVVVGGHLGGKRRARAHRGHPFCQDENARSCRDFAQVTGIIDDSGRAIQA